MVDKDSYSLELREKGPGSCHSQGQPALLRSLASSPAAAASTLRSRAKVADAETPEVAEELGHQAVMGLTDNEPEAFMDAVPGADPTLRMAETDEEAQRVRRRLLEMARAADKLRG